MQSFEPKNSTANAENGKNTIGEPQQDASGEFVSMYLKLRGYERPSSIIGSPKNKLGVVQNGRDEPEGDGLFEKYYFQFVEEGANSKASYSEMYSKLRKWINNSIPVYKIELRPVLFPLFVYVYLALVSNGNPEAKNFIETYGPEHISNNDDVALRLFPITEQSHVKGSQVAQNFIKNKYTVRMSNYSLQLLLSFLHYNKMLPILHILNEHVNVSISQIESLDSAKNENAALPTVGLFGSEAPSINSQSVDLSLLPLDSEMLNNMELYIKEKNPTDSQILTDEIKKFKYEHKVSSYFTSVPSAPDQKVHPMGCAPSRVIDVPTQLEILRASRNRVNLNNKSLPSICFYTFLNTYGGLNTLSISPETDYVAAGFSDSQIKIWDIKGDKFRTNVRFKVDNKSDEFPVSNKEISSSFYSKNNSNTKDLPKGLIDEANNVINEGLLFTPRPGSSVRLIGHSGPVYSTSFSADQKYLLSCSSDLTVRLWNLELMRNLVVYRGHCYPIWDVEFSPQNWYFATASHDNTSRIWSCAHSKQIRALVGHLSDVEVVKFHPNGSYLATGSSDRTAMFWDINHGTRVRIFCHHKAPVQALALSPDGKYLATAGVDKNVVLWDIGMGKYIKIFSGHTEPIYTLTFSRESSILASGGADETVRLWDVKNIGDTNDGCLGVYPTKSTPIYNLEFTRANLLISTGAFNPRQKTRQ